MLFFRKTLWPFLAATLLVIPNVEAGQAAKLGVAQKGDSPTAGFADGSRSRSRGNDPFEETVRLIAPDGDVGDGLGRSVAGAGSIWVIGAPGEGVGGAAYLFEEPEGGWAVGIEPAKLTASDAAPQSSNSAAFGSSVAIFGDTVVVGARGDDDAKGNNIGQGSAYVFVRPPGGWVSGTELAKLTASDGTAFDSLGSSIAIFEDTLMVGASGAGGGAVYVFVKPLGGWVSGTETAKLTASDAMSGDAFAISLALTSETLVVGALNDDVGINALQGSVYVFEKPAEGWTSGTETAKLTVSNGAEGDRLGRSVSVSGSNIVAGADQSGSFPHGRGSAYIFQEPPEGWVSGSETAKLTASDGTVGDGFGLSVAISGTLVAVGAADEEFFGRGSAYMFTEPLGGWVSSTETAKLVPSDSDSTDVFGRSVAIADDTIVVGASEKTIGGNFSQGAAYVYEFDFSILFLGDFETGGCSRWAQVNPPDAC